jgi:hypothetical protein
MRPTLWRLRTPVVLGRSSPVQKSSARMDRFPALDLFSPYKANDRTKRPGGSARPHCQLTCPRTFALMIWFDHLIRTLRNQSSPESPRPPPARPQPPRHRDRRAAARRRRKIKLYLCDDRPLSPKRSATASTARGNGYARKQERDAPNRIRVPTSVGIWIPASAPRCTTMNLARKPNRRCY